MESNPRSGVDLSAALFPKGFSSAQVTKKGAQGGGSSPEQVAKKSA
jgi:hypothetical protein